MYVVYVCICVYMYICMYVCMYAHMYMGANDEYVPETCVFTHRHRGIQNMHTHIYYIPARTYRYAESSLPKNFVFSHNHIEDVNAGPVQHAGSVWLSTFLSE